MVITEADVAVATVVLQRQAGTVGLSLAGLTLLNAVIKVAIRQRAAVERHLLRGHSTIVVVDEVTDRAVR